MKDNNKRKKYLLIVGILLAVFVVIGASFAYYNAAVTKVNETETNINTIVLGAGECNDVVMECLNVVPGDQCTKEFSIKNTNANTPLVANIYMRDIENEFYSDLDDLVYVLKDKDTGETVISETVVPGSQIDEHYLIKNLSIPGNTTKTYEFVVTYKYLPNISQNSFQGKEFKAGFCADTKQVTQKDASQVTCNGGDSCTKPGDILDPCDETKEKCDVVVDEPSGGTVPTVPKDNPIYPKPGDTPTDCTETTYKKRVYGTQVTIHHDLYYADQNLYENGKNKRYVTYCRPFKEGSKQGVEYCSKSNGKNCITSKSTVCSYQNAMKDLGNTSIKNQAFVEEFADQDNGNWHIQTYCQTAAKKTAWPGNGNGLYYCNKDATVLHDWYADSTSSASDVNNTKNSCNQSSVAYYAFGSYGANEFPTDLTEPPVGYMVYAMMDAQGNKSVCINREGQQCFQINNYNSEETHIQQVFSDITCETGTYNYPNATGCDAADFSCTVYANGDTVCSNDAVYEQSGGYEFCSVNGDGSIYCLKS